MVVKIAIDEHTLIADAVTFRFVFAAGIFVSHSDGMPEFSEEEYNTIDAIREIRNYWCHKCYLDFVYIENDYEREKAFQRVAEKLHYDEYRTYDLFKKTEEMRLFIMKKYR